MKIPRGPADLPYLTTEQMVEVDRAMIDDYGIELMQMMEIAGRHLAALSRARFLDGDPREKRVVIVAGTGGNGGGALVAARRLCNWGARVQVATTRPRGDFTPVPAHQLDILGRMAVEPSLGASATFPERADLIVDGIIGYSLQGAPTARRTRLGRHADSDSGRYGVRRAPAQADAVAESKRDLLRARP